MEQQEFKALAKTLQSETLNDKARAKFPEESFLALPCGNTHYQLGEPAAPNGETVVLVHGYSTPYYLYDNLYAALLEAGYRVLRYDLLGRGLSERIRGKHTPEFFAQQLLELTGAVLGKDAPFHLVGTSMGGSISMCFTALHPENVRKVVLLAPAGMDTFRPPVYMTLTRVPLIGALAFHLTGVSTFMRRSSEELRKADQATKDEFQRKFAAGARYKGYMSGLLSSLRNTILDTKKTVRYYQAVAERKTPVLCIWGTDDHTMPYYQSERFCELFPYADLVTFGGSGHLFLYDETERTMRHILPFLA